MGINPSGAYCIHNFAVFYKCGIDKFQFIEQLILTAL